MNPKLLGLSLALLVQGCATYQPAALPSWPDFTPVAQPQDGRPEPAQREAELNMTQAASLAVLNNPDLRTARIALRVSAAQSFSAGLLPDPQINLSRDIPEAIASGGSTAFVAGLGYAINALVTHGSLVKAGQSDDQQASLNLAWQEWQVIAQARLLFIRLSTAHARRELLLQARRTMSDRHARARSAMASGLITLDAVTPHLTALQDVDKQLGDLDRQTNQALFDLKALLGVAPETTLTLRGEPGLPPFDTGLMKAGLPALLNARPDLQALRAGFAAQDARYRAALLGQFPVLNLGVQRARDTSNAYTRGFSVNLSLPIFNGNRGEIAVQEATREKLISEYQQRLNAGSIDIHRLIDEQRISERQLADAETSLVTLRATRDRLQTALAAHNVDALVLASLDTATLAKENERLDAMQAIQEQRVALMTLTGAHASAASGPLSVQTRPSGASSS